MIKLGNMLGRYGFEMGSKKGEQKPRKRAVEVDRTVDFDVAGVQFVGWRVLGGKEKGRPLPRLMHCEVVMMEPNIDEPSDDRVEDRD